MGFEAYDLLRKGLGDVMIALMILLAMYWSVAVGLLFVTTTPKTIDYGDRSCLLHVTLSRSLMG